MSDFGTLIATARKFYGALDASNTRDWWMNNRGPYDEVLKPAALQLLEDLTPEIAKISDASVTSKLFRPHRDVRFSKDKTPYNTHLHMMWKVEAVAPQNPVYFFGIGLDYVTAGAGMMGFEKPVLANWRKMLDLDTDRMLSIVQEVEEAGFTLRKPALKRVPSPYDQDHPAAHLLRMKGAVASRELGADAALPGDLITAFRTAWPFNNLLLSIAEA